MPPSPATRTPRRASSRRPPMLSLTDGARISSANGAVPLTANARARVHRFAVPLALLIALRRSGGRPGARGHPGGRDPPRRAHPARCGPGPERHPDRGRPAPERLGLLSPVGLCQLLGQRLLLRGGVPDRSRHRAAHHRQQQQPQPQHLALGQRGPVHRLSPRRRDEGGAGRRSRPRRPRLVDARFQQALTTTNQFFDALAAADLLRVREASVRRAEEQLKVSVNKLRADPPPAPTRCAPASPSATPSSS